MLPISRLDRGGGPRAAQEFTRLTGRRAGGDRPGSLKRVRGGF